MALAPLRVVILGTSAFLVFWILAVFPAFKLLPIGRTAGALAGAILTVIFKVETPTQAYAAVDLSILGLLFGTMMVSVYLEKADMFNYLGNLLSWKSQGGKDLLCRVCVLSAISSALFTNDTCCLVLTEFVLKLCRKKRLPPQPFLIALATSANIGSVATPIGNPQNLVIAVQSGITFGKFLVGLLPSMVVGVFVNTVLLLSVYWKQLSSMEDLQLQLGTSNLAGSSITKEQLTATPWTPFHSGSLLNTRDQLLEAEIHKFMTFSHDIGFPAAEEAGQEYQRSIDVVNTEMPPLCVDADAISAALPTSKAPSKDQPNFVRLSSLTRVHPDVGSHSGETSTCTELRWKRMLWKFVVYIVATAMLAALLYGLDLSWTALTAAVALMTVDFCDAGPLLEKVSYPLLVFFASMFISVDGFNKTGIPSTFWEVVEPCARITDVSGEVVLVLVVIILSNVASNVPTVLLMGSRVAESATRSGASVYRAWLILAWASTIGGNLTLVGSAANLIVSEQALKAPLIGHDLTFFSHLLFGFPSTLIIAIIGLFLVKV